MTPNRALGSVSTQSETRQEVILSAEVRAHALCRMTRDQISSARRKPGNPPEGWPAVQPSLLRNSDDQTIAAMAAVHATLRRMGQSDPRCLEHWGILVSSRFLGRSGLVVALDRFRSDGVWGVSPHLIPHYALHSPAGTLSLALGVHGPNLGVGGGVSSEFEGILTALTWLKVGNRSRSLAGLQRLVAGVRSGPRGRADGGLRVSGPGRGARSSELRQARSAMLSTRRRRSSGISPAAGLDRSRRTSGPEFSGCWQRVQDYLRPGRPRWPSRPGDSTTTFRPANSGAIPPRTIASDASGRLSVELLSPKFPHVKEVG